MDEKKQLQSLREEIDAIDAQLHELINQRADVARRVADVKLATAREAGASEDIDFYRPEREAQVLKSVMQRNEGPLKDEAVARIFREVMSACLALEKPTQVAFLGPKGTYTHQAANKHFGQAASLAPFTSIAAVFQQVESEPGSYGVVPVENSTEGMVTHTLDKFMRSSVRICGEVQLRIRLQLLASPESSEEKIKRICGHQQALAQSQTWLAKNWPTLELQAVNSNGEAAKMAAEDPTTAAIASSMAAELYGLNTLAANIEDRADNATRFLVLGDQDVAPSGEDRSSIIVGTRNKPGALFNLLEPFDREGVMLTRIDTRPSQTDTWAYMFFIEFEGHREDAVVNKILTELEELSFMVKFLGSYPKAVF